MPRLALLGPLVLLCLAARSDELRLAPAPGLRLRKTFALEQSESLVRARMLLDGEEQALRVESSSGSALELVVVDRCGARVGAPVAGLERTFEKVERTTRQSSSFDGNAKAAERRGRSPLVGRSVRFTRDETSGAVAAHLVGEQGDPALTAGLRAELDLAALLPPHAVEVGERWSVPARALELLLDPGGELPIDWDRSSGAIEATLPRGITPTGELAVEYLGPRTQDGVSVGVLRLSGELVWEHRSEVERQEAFGKTLVRTHTTRRLALAGECSWSLAGGHLHALAVEGALRMQVDSSGAFHVGEQELAHSQELEHTGRLKLAVRFEALE